MSEIFLNSGTWLGSQEGKVVKSTTFTSESGTTITQNGRDILKSGTLVNDSALGYGFIVNDVDVTDGGRVGSLMIRGNYINSGLPSSLSPAQKTTIAQTGLFDVEKSVLQLFVEPVAGTETLLGKRVSDLQADIAVGSSGVLGTLSYVEGYTGFSGNVAEQSGHYLALKATALHGATIVAEVINGFHGPVTLDSDGTIVVRVANNNQGIRFTATYGDDSETVEYAFTNLTMTYPITASATNGTITGDSALAINGSAELVLAAGSGYDMPTSITVTGATTYSYDEESGVIKLYNATGKVTVSATCPTAINLQVVVAGDADGNVSGKVASDLQENIVVTDDVFAGTLKYITGYTAFEGDNQNGNFLMIKATALAGSTITAVVEFAPADAGTQVAYGSNGLIVCRIESVSERIKVTATIDGRSKTLTLGLDNLVIEHAPVGE